MSRRSRRPWREAEGSAPGAKRGGAGAGATDAGRGATGAGRRPYLLQAVFLIAVFLITTLIADLAGAANLGVAAGIGQIVFAIALMATMLRN